MRDVSIVALGCLVTLAAQSQDLRNVAPPEPPALQPEAPEVPEAAEPSPEPTENETPLLDSLEGIVLVPNDEPLSLQRLAAGVDASAVPLVQSPAFTDYLRQAIGKPASLAELQRLAGGVSRLLREQGKAFVSVWIPPQDLTDGVVRMVVRPARLEAPVQVVGARHFSHDSYLHWIRQRPGTAPDARQLQEDIDWINRNPFRHATLAAAPGDAPDSTRLSLRVRERRPLRVFAGTDSTGTENTGEERVSTGLNWGNAFGRGDQLSYQYRADPSFERSITHSGSYSTDLPWRHSLSVSAAWSETTPDLGPIFDQTGNSWQVGAQYRIPLPESITPGASIKHELVVGLDFKYTDNNLDFVEIPVMQNKTHVAQMMLGYSLSRETAESSSYLSPQLVLSPGELSKYNDDEAYDGSRFGARARYAYFRLDGEHSQRLPATMRWNVRANMQYSNVPLLGSEQIAGTGAYAVRGYPESGAFGDSGVMLSNELHLPPLQWSGAADVSLENFIFHDAAWLRTSGPDDDTIELHSAGLGAVLRWGSLVTLNVAYGWPLKRDVGGEDGSRALFRLQIAY